MNNTNICRICSFKAKDYRGLFTHITKKHNISRNTYYDNFFKLKHDGICLNCSKETTFRPIYNNDIFGEYRKLCYNCSRTQTDNILKIKYGDNWKKEKEKIKNTMSHAHSLDNFIRLYGEITGNQKYKNWLKNKAVTEDKLGSNRYIKWKNSVGQTLTNYIKKHGKTIGTELYNKYKLQTVNKGTLEWYINKHGEDEGTRRYKLKCRKGIISLNNFIRLYGDRDGRIRWDNFCKTCAYINTINFYIDKYGEKIGTTKYKIWVEKVSRGHGKISKISLKIFNKLTDNIKEYKFNILYGKKELCLFVNKSPRFYDFTIEELKFIIEYNGEHVHPNPKWKDCDTEKWNNWFNVKNKKTSEECYMYQKNKTKLANDNGYEVFEIWSSNTKDYNINLCMEKINEKINEYLG